MQKKCESCQYMHKSDEACWKGGEGKDMPYNRRDARIKDVKLGNPGRPGEEVTGTPIDRTSGVHIDPKDYDKNRSYLGPETFGRKMFELKQIEPKLDKSELEPGMSYNDLKKADLEKASTVDDPSDFDHYNYYLVHKQAGSLHGGFEYKQDAVDASKDYHIPASDLKVTHRSKIDPAVKEKFHRDNKVMSKLKKYDLEKAKIIDAKSREVKADLPSDEPTAKKGDLRLVASQDAHKPMSENQVSNHFAEILSIGHDPEGAKKAKAEKEKLFAKLEQGQMEKSDSEDLGVVPHSELAMHTKIAGKKIKGYKVKSPHMAEVVVEGSDVPVTGTHGEVLSHEIKSKLGKSELKDVIARVKAVLAKSERK